MNQGMTVHRAMKEAGYSQASLVQSSKFKKSPVVQKMMSGLKSKLVDKGFTVEFLADKFMEWMQADKTISTKFGEITNPDYDTQIKAYDRAKEILDIKETDSKVRRKLTIEEFVNEEEPPSA